DAPWFAFSVSTINQKVPMKHYHWKVLPQRMSCSPSICQWYVASLLSPVCAQKKEAIILHYMDDVLVCAPDDIILQDTLDLVAKVLTSARFQLQENKVQRMPPWNYLGLQIAASTIVPQKLEIRSDPKILADLHSLCGSLNWVRPWLGLTSEDLAPLLNLLKGERELASPRELTPEAKTALQKVQKALAKRQAHRYKPELPFKFIVLGKLPHIHGLIFQCDEWSDSLHVLEWVFLPHQPQKTATALFELIARMIIKCRQRCLQLMGADPAKIILPVQREDFDWSFANSVSLQSALENFSGQITYHLPSHRLLH
ncbi:POK18 protein, partial [Rhodinocichla rosea]|nr:POK18 protein [Rhodinocichla rosea]